MHPTSMAWSDSETGWEVGAKVDKQSLMVDQGLCSRYGLPDTVGNMHGTMCCSPVLWPMRCGPILRAGVWTSKASQKARCQQRYHDFPCMPCC